MSKDEEFSRCLPLMNSPNLDLCRDKSLITWAPHIVIDFLGQIRTKLRCEMAGYGVKKHREEWSGCYDWMNLETELNTVGLRS